MPNLQWNKGSFKVTKIKIKLWNHQISTYIISWQLQNNRMNEERSSVIDDFMIEIISRDMLNLQLMLSLQVHILTSLLI